MLYRTVKNKMKKNESIARSNRESNAEIVRSSRDVHSVCLDFFSLPVTGGRHVSGCGVMDSVVDIVSGGENDLPENGFVSV